MALTTSTMEYNPDSLQQCESPSLITPGTMLTPFTLHSLESASMTKPAVPKDDLRLPSLTAMAEPLQSFLVFTKHEFNWIEFRAVGSSVDKQGTSIVDQSLD